MRVLRIPSMAGKVGGKVTCNGGGSSIFAAGETGGVACSRQRERRIMTHITQEIHLLTSFLQDVATKTQRTEQ